MSVIHIVDGMNVLVSILYQTIVGQYHKPAIFLKAYVLSGSEITISMNNLIYFSLTDDKLIP